MRPFIAREKKKKEGSCVDTQGDNQLNLLDGHGNSTAYPFEVIMGAESTQGDVFERFGSRFLKEAVDGYNAALTGPG